MMIVSNREECRRTPAPFPKTSRVKKKYDPLSITRFGHCVRLYGSAPRGNREYIFVRVRRCFTSSTYYTTAAKSGLWRDDHRFFKPEKRVPPWLRSQLPAPGLGLSRSQSCGLRAMARLFGIVQRRRRVINGPRTE